MADAGAKPAVARIRLDVNGARSGPFPRRETGTLVPIVGCCFQVIRRPARRITWPTMTAPTELRLAR
jgi:hypothetical protein